MSNRKVLMNLVREAQEKNPPKFLDNPEEQFLIALSLPEIEYIVKKSIDEGKRRAGATSLS